MSSEPDNPPPGAYSIDPETGRDRVGPLRPNHGDRRHDLRLLRDLAIVNTRTHAELGPLPPDELPAEQERKPQLRRPTAPQATVDLETENDAMKLTHIAAAMALGTAGTLAAACQPGLQADGQDAAPSKAQMEPSSNPPASDATNSTDDSISDVMNALTESNTNYERLRNTLRQHGWSPVIDPKCREGVVGANHETVCAQNPDRCDVCDNLPGLSACSADGYCVLRFSGTTGNTVEVTMYGDYEEWDYAGPESMFFVTGWRFVENGDDSHEYINGLNPAEEPSK